jgi:hypothetical protein
VKLSRRLQPCARPDKTITLRRQFAVSESAELPCPSGKRVSLVYPAANGQTGRIVKGGPGLNGECPVPHVDQFSCHRIPGWTIESGKSPTGSLRGRVSIEKGSNRILLDCPERRCIHASAEDVSERVVVRLVEPRRTRTRTRVPTTTTSSSRHTSCRDSPEWSGDRHHP